jgi:hypothetical protein
MTAEMYDAKAIEAVVAVAKAEILADVQSGRVPATVAYFAELHDHVDANCYGGAEDAWFEGCTDDAEFVAFWNAVQDTLDAWIKAGGIAIGPNF